MFAPTVQGEGVNTGQLVGFLRLANCNLACSWCDTPYSWDWKRYDKTLETTEMDIADVADVINNWDVTRVIITGGEPLMQQKDIVSLISLCPEVEFDVETNGTITPLPELINAVTIFNVSPKLKHSGDIEKKRLKADALNAFVDIAWQGKAHFKFVCQSVADLDEVRAIADDYNIPDGHVWIMPEGVTSHDQVERLQILIDEIVKRRFNVSTRLHVLAWGSKRAV